MTTSLVTQESTVINQPTLVTYTVKEILAHVELIQHVMKEVMQEGQHYGKIPGIDKPTLLKPGAEKILETFRLASDPEVIDKSGSDNVTYRVKVTLRHQLTGAFIGAGVGECSTEEEKYKWRKPCCDQEWEDTPSDRRREKWIKPYDKEPSKVKQIRTNPADLANTVLKMAKKRALVDATLTATAASDIFVQDIEDSKEEPKQNKEIPAKTEANKKIKISEAQAKRFYAIWKANNLDDQVVRDYLMDHYGIGSTRDITTDVYDELCAWANG